MEWNSYWKRVYNEWATPIKLGIYADWCQNTENDINFIETVIGGDKSLKILDVSCGWGRHVIELRKLGYAVTGLDFSLELLKLANIAARCNNVSVPLVLADRQKLWWEEQFDVILQLYDAPWTEYWKTQDSQVKYLLRLYRCLKPGGYYITGTTDYLTDTTEAVKKETKQIDEQGRQMLKNLLSENSFMHYSYQDIRDLYEIALFAIESEGNNYETGCSFESESEGLVFVGRALKTTIEIWVYTRTPDIEVLLLRRTLRAGWGKVFWQPITGTISLNETPEEAALRELKEETGVNTRKKWIDLNNPFYFKTKGLGTLHKTMYAAEIDKQPITLDANEHDAYQWVPLNKVRELLYWDSNVKGYDIFNNLTGTEL